MSTRIVVGGLIASMAMGMWEMVAEALIGQGFWAPMVYISATLLRDLQSLSGAVQFDLLPVVLGLMGHMMNSVLLTVPFVLVARRVSRSVPGLAALGAGYGVGVYVVMWFLVLPMIDPVMLQLNAIVFLAGHMMWGGAIGAVAGWASRSAGTEGSPLRKISALSVAIDEASSSNAYCETCLPTSPEYLIRLY